jgi:geranylgeranyl diphosphate synthase type II
MLLRRPDELRAAVENYLAELALTPELHALEEPVRYALAGGGKRVRPVLCLATAEAAGADAERALPAAAAVELVHTFSLVHDDLPALDDDDERRGRPTVHVRFGEDVAVLTGDALLTEAFRLALSYASTGVARELAQATLGMIGGQYLDLRGEDVDVDAVNRLKTGRLFDAAVACGLEAAEVPEASQQPWRAFAAELGLLFQAVDDLLDGDGSVRTRGEAWTRQAADDAAARALAALETVSADTSVLAEIVETLAARTS